MVKMNVFGPKWAYFDSFGGKMGQTGFLGKSENVTSVRLVCRNFVQETYERIVRSRANGKTDKSEFVGLNSAPRGTKNGFTLGVTPPPQSSDLHPA